MQSFNFRQTSTFRVNKTHHLISLALLTFCINTYAEPLNTSLPITIDLPIQPLAESLKQFSKNPALISR